MSVSSFLLKKAQDVQAVDSELDTLFKSKTYAAPPRVEVKALNVTSKKRKLDSEKRESSTDIAVKRAKKEANSVPKRTKKKKDALSKDDSDSDESVAELKSPENEYGRASSDSEEDEDEPFDPNTIVHESLQKSKLKSHKPASKKKYVPPHETPEQRNLRTVFVGNLSVEVAKKRPLQKQLRKHLLSAVPTAKIESIRFRSVPFKDPTDLTAAAGEKSSDNKPAGKEGREHDKTRTAVWRNTQSDKDTNESKDDKKFLTPSQKKKIAFINQEFHSVADTVHAYVVFAHPAPILPSLPSSSTTPEPKPRKETMDPYEAAQTAARECDGTNFMDRLLRVDVVGKSSAGGPDGDPKLTIFVGNLDFASKEEDLRVFFEGVISTERGEPSPLLEDTESEEYEGGEKNRSVKKGRTWVSRVRIVRDRETQLGKGFAYVQFADRECVDEILALEEGKLKFAKRKLRVQRCKTIPGSSIPTKNFTADNHKSKTAKAQSHSKSKSQQPPPIGKPTKQGHPAQPPKLIIVPKGDPKLGDKLAHLSKGERKQAKAADADRVARRLAKKKARMAMGTKRKDQASSDDKKRVRVRKSPKVEPKKKKGRVRSEASVAKLNAKK